MTEASLFAAALEKATPAERSAYLVAACAGDEKLRRRVEVLLRAYAEPDEFLDRPLRKGTVDYEPIGERPGTMIGPYKLLQQLGEGGMGVVYMAEQEQPLRRRVALKIIKPGMDSAQVIARFEVERQALALMDHQNIARVLDAGTTESHRPYFVMELVHGVPITQYCDTNKLSPRQRLELFVPVCYAIQHAHQKGVIHRDLKPSNVMVTLHDGQPVPKVIDFGVAKATEQRLTERTLFTQYGTIVGTLEYMAPEQAELSGLGVDTRSDIYALGVLLYELLTGTTPLERGRLREAAYDEMLRLIREEEPARPSRRISTSGDRLATISAERNTEPTQLSRLVHGELDWIVMRCLEKDRTRRYETANGLARDLEHYLADEPVEACPPSAGYRLRKFARKHRKLLASAAAFAALLVLGVVASGWQAVRATQAEEQANANAVQALEKEQEANQQRDDAQRQRDEVRGLNERLQRTLYAAHMNLAHNAWDLGGVMRVRELLDQHRPKAGDADPRGFEWSYLYRLVHSDLLTLKHGRAVYCVAYSPDGKRLASASNPPGLPMQNAGEVKVWDAQTGQELLALTGHTGGVWGVAFSPDGKRLACASFDKTVRVWDTQTGHELLKVDWGEPGGVGAYGQIYSVAFSPDGKRLAGSGDSKLVKVWDAQTGKPLLTLGTTGPANTYVAFSPDGKRLASASYVLGSSQESEVKVWDAQTGKELYTKPTNRVGRGCVAFSPDGKRLASASEERGTVKVWDAQTGQELLTLKGHGGPVYSVAFSSDSKRLASSSGATVKIWDVEGGQEILTLKGHTSGVMSVAFSPDGKHLASASIDQTVRVWDAQVGQKPLTLKGGPAPAWNVAFSPDGKRLASAAGGGPFEPWGVKVWDAQTSQELLTIQGGGGVAFSPDGKRLASGSSRPRQRQPGDGKVWDVETGEEILTLKGAGGFMAFSPDGKRLASAGFRLEEGKRVEQVMIWDAQTSQELLALKGHTGQIRSVAFSPDGKRLASASWDNTLKVWDTQTGQELSSFTCGNGASVNSVAFSPDGHRLASSSGFDVKTWNAQTGKELLTFKGHTSDVNGIIFSPDGKRLASTSQDDTLRVWDAQAGQELLTLTGHTGGVGGVAFSPDGKRLASGAADGTVTIWDATPLPSKP
jgi:WD40 repeat protein/serine/threonine protein kinase